MMPKDYTALFDTHDAEQAGANLNGAQGVAPAAAIEAFKAAPTTGVAPSLSMVDPQPQSDLAAQQRDTALLEVPSIRKFAATSPAHVAATREDWPKLAEIAGTVARWNHQANVDFLAPGVEAGQALAKDAGRFAKARPSGSLLDFVPGFSPQDRALGSTLQDAAALVFSPLSGALNVAARPLSAIPMPNADGRGGFRTQPETQAEVANILGTALMGLGAGRALTGPRPGPLALEGPSAPPRPTPGVRPEETPVHVEVAKADAAHIAAIEEGIAETKVHSEVPALTEEFLSHTDAAGHSAWVDPQALVDLYAEGHTVLPQYAQKASEALSAGRDLQVPLSAYLTDVSGKPYADMLRERTRFREEGVSVEGAKELSDTPPETSVPTGTRERSVPEDIPPEFYEPIRALAANADSAVEEVFAEQALKSLFVDNKALGLTKGQFDRYDTMLAEAKAATTERVLAWTYAQIRRERTPEWQVQVAQHNAAVEQTLAKVPALAAYSELTRGKGVLGEELETPIKLASNAQLSAHGKDLGLPKSMFSASGLDPDDAAPFLGFETGIELLQALATVHQVRGEQTFPTFLAGMVDNESTVRARTALGYDVSVEGIAAAAREAAIVPQVEDFLEASLKDLAASQGLPFEKATVKAEAQRQFDALTVKDAIRVRTFERGMWATGNRTQIALEKGDWPKAFISRQQQLLNFYQLEMAHFLAKKVAVGEKKFRRLAKKATIKGLSQPFLDQLHTYLPQWGYANRREPQELAEALRGVSLPEFIDNVIATNADFPSIPEVAPSALRDLPVSDYWKVRGFIFAMDRYGRELQQARIRDKTEEFNEVVERALANAPPGKPPRALTLDQKPRPFQALMAGLRNYDASHRKVADMVEWLDRNDPFGVFAEMLTHSMYGAADAEGRMHREAYEPVTRAWEKVPDAVKRGYDALLADAPFAVGGRKLRDGTLTPLVHVAASRKHIIPLALYSGTEESLRKAAEGYNTTPEELLAFINRHITPEEVAVVKEIWRGFETLSAPVSEALRALTAQGLRRVEPVPVTLSGVSTRGGYWPIKYNRALNPDVEAWEAEREATLNPNGVDQLFGELMPNKGFSEERTKYVGPVDVDLQEITRAFNSHIKYAAYARPVSSARKFVYDPRIAALVRTRMGEEYLSVIPDWLNSIVVPFQMPEKSMRWMEGFLTGLRRNMTTGILAASYSTLVSQAAGAANAIAALSDGQPVEGVARLLGGYSRFAQRLARTEFRDGKLTLVGLHEMFERSEFMRQRYGALEQNLTEALLETEQLDFHAIGLRKNLRHLQRTLYSMIGWMEFLSVSGPQWEAAIQKAEGMGMSEERATQYANRLVVKSQGAGRKVDLAAIQRGPAIQRMFYSFQSFFNQQYQWAVDVGRHAAGGGGGAVPPAPPDTLAGLNGEDSPGQPSVARYNRAKALTIILSVFILSVVMQQWLTNKKLKWTDVFFNLMRPLFGLNTLANAVDRHVDVVDGHVVLKNTWDTGLGGDLLNRAGEIVEQNLFLAYNAAKGNKLGRPVQTLAGIGQLSGVPASAQLGRTGEYAYELATGAQVPRSDQAWSDLYHGLTGGPQREQSTSTGRGRRSRRSGR